MTIPHAFDINASWDRLLRNIFTEKNIGRATWLYSFSTDERYQNNMKDMYRMITEVDTACKNIVNELEEQGVLNETLVIFTTDDESSALVRKDFKYIRYDKFHVEALFDLKTDPMELNDVLNNPVFTKQLAAMRTRYEEFKIEAAQPLPHNYTGLRYYAMV
jgi:arylsulfatase A-like enzyme